MDFSPISKTMDIKVEEANIDISIHHLEYVTEMNDTALVILPGLGDTSFFYQAIAAQLHSRFSYNIYVVDYPGFGKSEALTTSTKFLLDQDVVVNILTSWLQTTVHTYSNRILCGYSIGSAIATVITTRHPGYFHQLVLNTPIGFSKRLPLQVKLAATRMGSMVLRLLMSPRMSKKRWVQDVYFNSNFHDKQQVTSQLREYFVEAFGRRSQAIAYTLILRLYISRGRIRQQYLDRLHQSIQTLVTLPINISVVWAEHDKVSVRENLDYFKQFPMITITSINTGHTCFMEDPVENATLIGQFS